MLLYRYKMASRTATSSPASKLVYQVQCEAQKTVCNQVRKDQSAHISRMYVYEFLQLLMRSSGRQISALQNQRMNELEDEVLDTYLPPDLVHAYASVHGFVHEDGTTDEARVTAHITRIIDAEKKKMLKEIRVKLATEKSCIVCLKRPGEHLFKCSQCYCCFARYCCAECQRVDWPLHKVFCADLAIVMKSSDVLERYMNLYTAP